MSKYFKSDMLGVYVALMALLASQLPPVHTFFQKPRPEIDIGDSIGLTHSFGNIELMPQVTISNNSPVPFKITSIDCALHSDDMNFQMRGDRYYSERVGENNMVVGEYFSLSHGLVNPGMSYTINVVCTNILPETSEHRIMHLLSEIESFQTRQVALGCMQNNSCSQTLEDEHLTEAHEIFVENFQVDIGEYDFSLVVNYEGGGYDIFTNKISINRIDIGKLNNLPLYYYRTGGGNIIGRLKIVPVVKRFLM